MKYVHTNIVTGNLRSLADFYINVFECKQTKPEGKLLGDWLEKGTGVKDANIKQIDLQLPGYDGNGPVLEIFEYSEVVNENLPPVANQKGLRHLAFKVENVTELAEKAVSNGGKRVGELITKEFKSGTLEFSYITDPEGNLIEVQSWKAN
jgi:predicted enzyme related to lactoylglutathione lyase